MCIDMYFTSYTKPRVAFTTSGLMIPPPESKLCYYLLLSVQREFSFHAVFLVAGVWLRDYGRSFRVSISELHASMGLGAKRFCCFEQDQYRMYPLFRSASIRSRQINSVQHVFRHQVFLALHLRRRVGTFSIYPHLFSYFFFAIVFYSRLFVWSAEQKS